MRAKHITSYLMGLYVFVHSPVVRSERGLSQSAENAILLAGAVAVATAVIVAIRAFVLSHMPK